MAAEYGAAMARELEILRQWLENGLKKRGKTQAALGIRLNCKQSTVSKMASGMKPIRIDQLPLIAAYIEEPIPEQFLIQLGTKSSAGAESVFLVGKIDSLSWRLAVGQLPVKTYIPKYPEEPYVFIKQEAFQVEGDSGEPYARHGEFVLSVDYDEAGLLAQADDIVVTIEKRDFDGVPFVRSRLRRVVQRGRDFILIPLSGPAEATPIDAVTIRYVIGKALYNARHPHR
jgi:transcriptional regulator with XRE-family HTH domain